MRNSLYFWRFIGSGSTLRFWCEILQPSEDQDPDPSRSGACNTYIVWSLQRNSYLHSCSLHLVDYLYSGACFFLQTTNLHTDAKRSLCPNLIYMRKSSSSLLWCLERYATLSIFLFFSLKNNVFRLSGERGAVRVVRSPECGAARAVHSQERAAGWVELPAGPVPGEGGHLHPAIRLPQPTVLS